MSASIAFLGTGLMGAPMASRLLAAGFPLHAWNRTPAKAEALVPCGARVAGSPGEAVRDADIVICMLDSGPVVEDVLFSQGAAAAMKRGSLLIDMSSIPPATARACAARLADLGVAHVDAPVSGGVVGAAAGTLAIMAGGDAADVERAAPVFAAMGRATHVGPHGSGQLAKLANQLIVATTIAAVSEALLLAAAGGADPVAVRSALRGGFAESRILEVHGARMLERNFVPGGAVRNQLKDIDTALAQAGETQVSLPVAARVREIFAELAAHGGGEYDHSAFLLELERMNSPHRVGDAEDRLPA